MTLKMAGPAADESIRRQLAGVFTLRDALPQPGLAVDFGANALSFETPAQRWAYAVRFPAAWPPAAGWVRERDGSIRVRLRVVDGAVSALIVGNGGDVIDEVAVREGAAPVDVDLVCSPLGACQSVVIRNVRDGGKASRVELLKIACQDVWPMESGDVLDGPEGLMLAPDEHWGRYYGSELPVAERLRAVRYRSMSRIASMRWLEDLVVRIHPNDDLSRALYVSGLYEPSAMVVLRRLLPPGGVFIDVGANAGLFSLVASRWATAAGRVYAFEASQREFERLRDHVAINRLTNVHVFHQAVGGAVGRAELRVAPYPHAGLNTLGSSFAFDTATERIETVDVTTLDEFAAAGRLARVDAIKIDVEGSEHAVLSGARSILAVHRPAVILEVSGQTLARCGTTPADVIGLLTQADYRLHRIGPNAELEPLGDPASISDANLVALPMEQSAGGR